MMRNSQPNYWNLYAKKDHTHDSYSDVNHTHSVLNNGLSVYGSLQVGHNNGDYSDIGNIRKNTSTNNIYRSFITTSWHKNSGDDGAGCAIGITNDTTNTSLQTINITRDYIYPVLGNPNLGQHQTRWGTVFAKTLDLGGDIILDSNTTERKITSNGINVGFYWNKDGRLGLYDWKNNRGAILYNSNSNRVDMTPNTYFAGHIYPQTHNGSNMGTTNHRWGTVYAVNALNTSDREYKENIEYISDVKRLATDDNITYIDIYEFYKDINIATYNYKQQEHTEFGFIANDIAESKVGKALVVDSEEGYMYSIGSYVSSLAGALKQAIHEIEDLKLQIKELKG